MNSKQRELLREAYAIIAGIPEEKIRMNTILSHRGEVRDVRPKACGSIGCAIGWLSMHPGFQEKTGLVARLTPERAKSHKLLFQNLSLHGLYVDYNEAAVEVFGLSKKAAYGLFNPVGDGGYLGDQVEDGLREFGHSDKDIFLSRVRKYLKNKEVK